MSTYRATVRWSRGADPFAGQQYSRGHKWIFDGGVVVPASASPHVVRAPWSVPEAVDPEEAFIAALHHRAHEACYIANSVRCEEIGRAHV